MRLQVMVLAGLLLGGSAAPVLAVEELVSGTAVYELTLDPAKGMAGVGGSISGRMETALVKVCESYSTTTRLDAQIMPSTGGAVTMKLDSDLLESKDSLTFRVAGRFGLQVLADTAGEARLTGDGIAVKITRPDRTEFALGGGPVVFPIAFIQRAIEAAKAGERFLSLRMFDGSEREIWTVSVVIGDPRSVNETEDEKAFAEALGISDMKRWPMRLSYFPPGGAGDQAPVFATGAVVYENGASLSATYEFPMFAMKLNLVEYRPAEPKGC